MLALQGLRRIFCAESNSLALWEGGSLHNAIAGQCDDRKCAPCEGLCAVVAVADRSVDCCQLHTAVFRCIA
jgi:hypothetical protein